MKRTRVLGIGRAAVAFCVALELMLTISALSAGQDEAPLALCFLAVSIAIALRAAVVGCHVGPDDMVVRSWLRTSRISLDAITGVRSVAYSGYANEFSQSRLVSMVAIEIAGRRLPRELRFTADTPSRVRRAACLLRATVMEDRVRDPGPRPCPNTGGN